MTKIYKGNIIFTKNKESFNIIDKGYIKVNDGIVESVFEVLPLGESQHEVVDFGDQLLIPGFVDIHFHAPQYENIGLGYDEQLLGWLEKYTFKAEAKYGDLEYSKKAYELAVDNVLINGTTRAVILGTIHRQSTIELTRIAREKGLIAYIGKVNMDRNSPKELLEDSQESYEETLSFVEVVENAIITPRFVPSCTFDLMVKLGQLAKEQGLPIQTHLSENRDEIKWVSQLQPEASSYLDVYDRAGLVTNRSIFAHCVYCTESELELMSKRGSYVAMCANANFNLSSGIIPIRKVLDHGVKVGLGTDVGAGHKMSIKDVMVTSIQASKMRWLESEKREEALSLSEAFYLGTKGGGEFFGKVGSFEPGYEFDMLVIDDASLKCVEELTIRERLEKFIYVGDDRNITHRFVKGKSV